MSEKGKRKKWYKNIWIWLTVLGVVLCAVNIVFACIYNREGANIFTAISGWVSFLATILVGVIAFQQNQKYMFLSHKQVILNSIQNEQSMFSSEVNEISDIGKYANVITKMILLSERSEPEESLELLMSCTGLIVKIQKFSASLFHYQYCPMEALNMYQKCDEMLHFLAEEVNEDAMPNPALNPKEFKKKGKELGNFLTTWINSVVSIRMTMITEMQFLSNEISKKKSLKALLAFEQKIMDKDKEMRKALWEARMKSEEQNNGKIKDAIDG